MNLKLILELSVFRVDLDKNETTQETEVKVHLRLRDSVHLMASLNQSMVDIGWRVKTRVKISVPSMSTIY